MQGRHQGRHLPTYVGMVHRAEETVARSLRQLAQGHDADVEGGQVARVLADRHDEHVHRLAPIARRYGEESVQEPERLHADELSTTRPGPVGLLRDLQDVHLLATLLQTSWTVVHQAAIGARDTELERIAEDCLADVQRTLTWLLTHLKVASPQVLLVSG
jgi:hypothetical protein